MRSKTLDVNASAQSLYALKLSLDVGCLKPSNRIQFEKDAKFVGLLK